MSQDSILEISVEQQEWMLKELRSCRYSYLLALHIVLLIAKGKTSSAITDFPLCSRSKHLSRDRGLAGGKTTRAVVAYCAN
jgi:hypothetical protein